MKLINTKYIFPNFNILLYADNFIFPVASAPAEKAEDDKENSSKVSIREDNREQIYDLYYKALKLEPEPANPELTFTERQGVAKARQFITMRMRKRSEMRKAKQQNKERKKMQKMIS